MSKKNQPVPNRILPWLIKICHFDPYIDGYMAVGLVDSQEEIVWLEEIHTYEQDVRFKIDADFDTHVTDDNAAEFKQNMISQISNALQCEPINIQELKVKKGSIIVEFLLVGYTDLEADELEQSYDELVAIIEAGEFQLVSF